MGKLDTAVDALYKAATALDEVPERFRRTSLFGPIVVPDQLRKEAEYIEGTAAAIREDRDL